MTSRRILYAVFAVLGVVAVACGLVLQLRMVAEDEPAAAAETVHAGDPAGSAGAAGSDESQETATQKPEARASPGSRSPEVTVLAEWDERRAAAYSSGDLAALEALYRPGSRSGAADLRMLQEYADRGLRVRGMRTQLLAVEVIDTDRTRMVLDVTDRLVGAEVVGRGGPMTLPVDRADRRRVTLVRLDGTWLVAEARQLGRRRGPPSRQRWGSRMR